jgi:hypothetical protein
MRHFLPQNLTAEHLEIDRFPVNSCSLVEECGSVGEDVVIRGSGAGAPEESGLETETPIRFAVQVAGECEPLAGMQPEGNRAEDRSVTVVFRHLERMQHEFTARARARVVCSGMGWGIHGQRIPCSIRARNLSSYGVAVESERYGYGSSSRGGARRLIDRMTICPPGSGLATGNQWSISFIAGWAR